MTRGLIIVKTANVQQARTLAQQPPFSITPETAELFLVPANPVRDEFGTSSGPATLHWASGVFEDDFWAAIVQAASFYDWGEAWEYDYDTEPDFPLTKLQEFIAAHP